MQTYLDWYIDGYTKTVERLVETGGVKVREIVEGHIGKPLASITDLDAARFVITNSHLGLEPGQPLQLDEGATHVGNLQRLNHFLLPFVMSEKNLEAMRDENGQIPGMFVPVAIKPSVDLIYALSRTSTPEGQADVAWEELRRATFFMDIPHRSLLIGDAEVRAIFTQPAPTVPTVAAFVVLTLPGSNKTAGRLIWLLGQSDQPMDGISAIDVDEDALRRQVESMIQLLVLYRKYVGQAQRSPVPFKPADQMVGRKASQIRKKFSMFHVEGLAPPPDRFGRDRTTEDRAGWKLGWRSEVSGHFKLQAHGANRLERKWIWVEAYERGPVDAPRKKRIELLDISHSRDSDSGDIR